MAKPIELVLVLDREESVRFQKYIDNPTYTEEGRDLIREAAEHQKESLERDLDKIDAKGQFIPWKGAKKELGL